MGDAGRKLSCDKLRRRCSSPMPGALLIPVAVLYSDYYGLRSGLLVLEPK